jgi:hypothetical protein
MQEHDALWRAIKDFNELNGLCEGLPQVTDASSESEHVSSRILHSPNAISRMKVKLCLLSWSSVRSFTFYELPLRPQKAGYSVLMIMKCHETS